VYLHGYATLGELLLGLTKYFAFYNGERPHQGLGKRMPDEVYASAVGGGAMIVDKYGGQGLEKTAKIELKERGSADQLQTTFSAA
jgi:putative transposase